MESTINQKSYLIMESTIKNSLYYFILKLFIVFLSFYISFLIKLFKSWDLHIAFILSFYVDFLIVSFMLLLALNFFGLVNFSIFLSRQLSA